MTELLNNDTINHQSQGFWQQGPVSWKTIFPQREGAAFRMIQVHYIYFAASDLIGREGDGTPLQYSCLENPMDGGVW